MKLRQLLWFLTALLLVCRTAVGQTPCTPPGGCPFPTAVCSSSDNSSAICQGQEPPPGTPWLYTAEVFDTFSNLPPPQTIQSFTLGANIMCGCDATVVRHGYSTLSDGGDPPILFTRWSVSVYQSGCPGDPPDYIGSFVTSGSKDMCFRLKQQSPILISFTPGADIQMTSAEEGVNFDFEGYGQKMRLGWTRAGDEVAWLTSRDVVATGRDLFGNQNPQADPLYPNEHANGYRALRLKDDNNDGRIDASDSVFSTLRLWFDYNHNGESDAGESKTLASMGVAAISLDYKIVGKKDEYGNKMPFRADVTMTDGTKRTSYDVFHDYSEELTPKMFSSTEVIKPAGVCMNSQTGLLSFSGWISSLLRS